MKYDTNWFINRIKEKRPNDYNEYEVVGNYVNAHTKIEMVHKVCNRHFMITPNSFLNGKGCPPCGYKRGFKKQQISIDEVYKRIPTSYELLEEPKSVTKRMNFYCKDCGRVIKVSIHGLERNQNPICAYCRFVNNNKDTDEFKWQLSLLVGNEYQVLGNYTNAKTKIEILHTKCNKSYKVTPHNFLRGKRCPYCNQSKGEEYIDSILKEQKVEYFRQYKFKDCVYKKPLPFDFYLPKYKLAIEYDGEQHFKPIKHFGGAHNYLIRKERDKTKTQYCKRKGIKLLRIPYTISFDNINKLIKNYIK